MIPAVLQEIVNHLKESRITLPRGGGDGRNDSSNAERDVINALQNANKWRVHSPNRDSNTNRAWYDILITDKTNNFYCDIKISNLKGNDKTNANNLPFQCKWSNCRVPKTRNWSEARNFLLSEWAKSIKKGIKKIEERMPTYYPDFFN